MTTTLIQFIEKHGDEKCSELFKVKVRTVASWRRRERYPNRKQALAIVSASNGQLTLEGVYAQ